MPLDIAARRADFRALHSEGYFLLPTAWDVGGAKRLEALGYAGFSSTISNFARTLGRETRAVTRDDVLNHLRKLVNATEIAVNADFVSGFATDAAGLMANVRLAVDTGIEALSINDRASDGLVGVPQAIARVRTCRDAIASSGADVLLIVRAEGLISTRESARDVIGRLIAHSNAGADVLCAPGLSNPADIEAAVAAVAPKPLDVQLVKPGLTAAELGRLGVRRISVGDSFAEAAWASFDRAAEEFIDYGDLLPARCPNIHDAAE